MNKPGNPNWQASSTHPCSSYRIRDGGRTSGTEAVGVPCLGGTEALVQSQPESRLRSRMVACRVGDEGRDRLRSCGVMNCEETNKRAVDEDRGCRLIHCRARLHRHHRLGLVEPPQGFVSSSSYVVASPR